MRADVSATRELLKLTNERKMKVMPLDAQMVLIRNEAKRRNKDQ